MTRTLKLALFASMSALTLGACGGGNDGSPSPAGPTALEDNFGTGFGALFRASANTDPADPTATSVIAVSLTTDPVPVP